MWFGVYATCMQVSEEEEERMVGLDCEMCITAEGFELTRITLVDRKCVCAGKGGGTGPEVDTVPVLK